MPRGVYDRAAAKARRVAKTKPASADNAPIAVKAKGRRSSKSVTSATVSDISPLEGYLQTLLAARESLTRTQIEHNAALVNTVDQELFAVMASFRSWREDTYPTIKADEPSQPSQKANKTTPSVGSNPAPAPLPFTPQSVQEALKQTGQA